MDKFKQYDIHILILVFILIINIEFIPMLIVDHYQENEELMSFYLKEGDEFTMKWIHSVEFTPWEETFKVSGRKIILDRTRFQQFGAGVPDNTTGKYELIDDYIVFSQLNIVMDTIPYGISEMAKHTLLIKDKEYYLYKMIPDGNRVNIYMDKKSIVGTLIDYVKKNEYKPKN